MSKGSDVIEGLLKTAKANQSRIAESVRVAERTLVKRRTALATANSEVQELEADLAAIRRRALSVVA